MSTNCSKHVEDSNIHIVKEIVRQVGYVPELFDGGTFLLSFEGSGEGGIVVFLSYVEIRRWVNPFRFKKTELVDILHHVVMRKCVARCIVTVVVQDYVMQCQAYS
jgi:hypothetical protein